MSRLLTLLVAFALGASIGVLLPPDGNADLMRNEIANIEIENANLHKHVQFLERMVERQKRQLDEVNAVTEEPDAPAAEETP